jgi:hypothetical protein
MTKPLELTWYTCDECGNSDCFIDDDAHKQLADAELAAEHWCYCTLWFAAVRDDDDYEGAPETRERQRRAEILERFATRPHASESDYK